MKKEIIQFKDHMPFTVTIQSLKKYPIHWHEDVTEILMPIKGSVEVTANFEHILVKEGDFWFINNKTIHSIRSEAESIIAIIHIDLNYFEQYFEYIKYMFFRNNMYSEGNIKIESDNFDDPIRKGYKTRFRTLLVSVLADLMNEDQYPKELTLDSVYQLVASMVQEFNWLQFLKKSNDFISPLQLDRYHRIVKYIDEHYHERITLDDIAKQEFITKNYFSHLWKNLSHFSFNERLNYERTLKSEFLLLTTNMSLSAIAEKCGFSDVKYYYKHFRRWYGVNPLEHKKRCLAYMESELDSKELELSSISHIIEDYIKEVMLPDYAQDDLWKTTSLFDNFVKMKYLYKFDKITPQPPPRGAVVNVLNANNFRTKKGKCYFNWQNIDLLVNFSETSDFQINIKLDCQFLDTNSYKDVLHTFLDSCIYRYRIVTLEKWYFFITYQDDESFKMAIDIGKLIANKIPKSNVRYFFEV